MDVRNRQPNLLMPYRISLISLLSLFLFPVDQLLRPDLFEVIGYLNSFFVSFFKLHLEDLLLLIKNQLSFPMGLNCKNTRACAEAAEKDWYHKVPPLELETRILFAVAFDNSDVTFIVFFCDV